MSDPVVAIIGRPNVGKSTFFNRILGERRAVVHDRPGITRDRNAARAEWTGRTFMLVDTGGFLAAEGAPGEVRPGRDAAVRRQAEAAIGLAHVVVFLVDARTGVTDLDAAIAQNLRKRSARCLLVVNKVDKPADTIVHEFHRLGLGVPHAISAENGTGIGDLLDAVLALLPEEGEPEVEPRARVAIIGRPNVGKSSIVNALLGEDRMLVEPQAGTTVDAIDSVWKTEHGEFVLVDTAGIRRQAHFGDEAEFFATMRALNALERADLALVVVDANEGFQRQEARLAHHALDAGCSVLLLYNKWDLITEREAAWKRMLADRESRYPTLGDLPAMPLSATENIHLGRLASVLQKRIDEHARKIPTSQLNDWLAEVQKQRQAPSTHTGRAPKIYYLTQTGSRPPAFTLFVNEPGRLSDNYRTFLMSRFNDHFGFRGTPVRMRIRKSD
ncbi:MAG: ribosome biogenesis GTPase Der [Candidatus Eisenbacteria bacterium]